MKVMSATISILFAFGLFLSPCMTNASALTLDEVRAAMPPESGPAADALFNQLLAEEDGLIFALCNLITPPDGTPDAQAEYALFGLAKHVVGPGRETQRTRVTRILEVALGRVKHPDVQRFFMAQLRICGDATTVRVLEPYVCDPVVYDDAVRTIAAIGGLEGLASLLLLDCPDAPKKNDSIQNAILGLNTQPYYDPNTTGLSAELLSAMALPDTIEDKNRIAALCREALQKEDLEPRYGVMALQTLARLAGPDALPDLLQAVNSPHRTYWGVALTLAEHLPGEEVSRAWVQRLPELNEAVRPLVIAMLGKRKDSAAREAVRDAFKSPASEVRLAAYESITRHSDPALVGPLMDAMAQADSDAEIQAIKSAFLRLPELEAAMQKTMVNRPADAGAYTAAEKVAYLEMLRERQAASFRDVAVALINDPDDGVRQAAYAALAAVGEAEHLPVLYQHQLEESSEAAADAARGAIAALAKRLKGEDEAVAQAATRLADASGQDAVRLLKTLGTLGTPAALKAVQGAADTRLFVDVPDADLASALFETLSAWQNADGGAALQALWQRLENEALRLAALKQYIAHVRRTGGEPEQQSKQLSELEGLCKTDAERQEVTNVISRLSR